MPQEPSDCKTSLQTLILAGRAARISQGKLVDICAANARLVHPLHFHNVVSIRMGLWKIFMAQRQREMLHRIIWIRRDISFIWAWIRLSDHGFRWRPRKPNQADCPSSRLHLNRTWFHRRYSMLQMARLVRLSHLLLGTPRYCLFNGTRISIQFHWVPNKFCNGMLVHPLHDWQDQATYLSNPSAASLLFRSEDYSLWGVNHILFIV